LRAVFLCPKVGDNLICPYNNKSETSIQNWKQDHEDESQILTKGKTITQTVYEPMICQEDECGAYYGGRCHYKD